MNHTSGNDKVYVVESGEYSQRSVCGVYISPEVALECTKARYNKPYIVKWSELKPETDSYYWGSFTGEFEAVQGYSTKHVAVFDITEYKLEQGNDMLATSPDKHTDATQMRPAEPTLQEQLRKIIRDYYNHTFEYSMEQLQKGDISSVIANAESEQQELDDSYITALIKIIEKAERKARIEELERFINAGVDSGLTYGGMDSDEPCIELATIKDRIKTLKGEEN